MKKVKVLHIGIKNWPYDSTFSGSKKRGGGSNKYTNLLINGFSGKVDSFIITQLAEDQKIKENYPNGASVHRIKTFCGRKLSQVIFNIKGVTTAIRIIKKNKIDIIHGHMLVGIIISVVLGKIFRKPTIATPYSVYTTEFGFPLINMARFLERTFYRLSDTIVFESEENKEKALKYLNVPLPKSMVIVTGIDVPPLPLAVHNIDYYKSNKIKILFIGRIVNIKALDNLFYGISKLRKDEKEKIIVDIVGEGEEYSRLKKIINEERLNNVVRLRGFVKNLKNYLQNGDIFILPSYMEGLSIALLEAMSYGLACIVNNFGVPFASSVYEMRNNNPETIKLALSNFISNPDMINEYKKKARYIIENQYTIEKFSLKYYNLYQSLRKEYEN